MEYKNYHIWNWKAISLLIFLAIFPNFLGMINISTSFGFKIHFFQYLVFLAAVIYGRYGGLAAGAFGSVFSAVMLNNPYIVIGNMLLGFFVGYFFENKINIILSVLLAFLIQLPWLYFTDVYLVGMPVKVVYMIMVALFVSNMLWACLVKLTYKSIIKSIR